VLGYSSEFGGDMVHIGCEQHTLQHWLDNYKAIGEEAGYSPPDIRLYGKAIKLIAEALKR